MSVASIFRPHSLFLKILLLSFCHLYKWYWNSCIPVLHRQLIFLTTDECPGRHTFLILLSSNAVEFRTLVFRISSYPNRLGFSGKFIENSTKLSHLEIIRSSSVQCYWLLELPSQVWSKGLGAGKGKVFPLQSRCRPECR